MCDDNGDLYGFYTVDADTEKLIYDKNHLQFKTLRDAFAMSGVDIDTIDTEAQLNEIWRKLEDNVMQVVMARILSRDPNNLEAALLQALVRDDYKEADRIHEKLRRRRAIGLRSV